MMKTNFKSGFVAILGRPNVGKSTLLNHFLGTKVAIVTPKAQTTRNRLQGILTTDDAQIIFVDTPGFHKAFNALGEYMNEAALQSLAGVDLVLLMVDATKRFDELDAALINTLNESGIKTFLIYNKMDLVKKQDEFDSLQSKYQELKHGSEFKICAENHLGVEDLLKAIHDTLPNGPRYYSEDEIIDQSERFVVGEIIREKVLLLTEKEVPHSVAVTVETMKQSDKQNLVNIQATIIVERPSQKAIIIGKGGAKIKEIGTAARKDIASFLDQKVYLELFVKVEKDWRNQKRYLKEYGYEE